MALAQRDILLEVGVARCRDILESMHDKGKIEYDRLTGCWLSSLTQNRDGYIDIKRYTNQQITQAQTAGQTLEAMFGKNGGKHYYLHRIGFVAFHGQNTVDQASHICAAPNCVRGNHMVDETGQVNNSRSNCKGPGLLDDQNHLLPMTPGPTNCRHQPPCFPHRDMVVQCPHQFAMSAWSVPRASQVTIPQWINGANLAPAPPPPPAVVQASQEELFSDAFTEDDNNTSPLVMPSSPPVGFATQYAQYAPVPPLNLQRESSSSRPGSSSSSLPVRPGRPPQLPPEFPSEIPDSEQDSGSGM